MPGFSGFALIVLMEARYLNGFLAEIAAVAGVDAALAIASAKGGQRVFFPSRKTFARKGGWMIAVVGEEAARKIADLFSIGHMIEVPSGGDARLQMRRDIARRLLRMGLSVNEVAGKSGFHRRTVSRYRAQLRKERKK